MQRSKNVDKIRACACLLVLIYHCWVLCGSTAIPVPIVKEIVTFGGDIGVTTFFILSGYGIYYSLNNMEQKGGIKFKDFIKKRIKRIVPQYYFNLIVALLFTGSAVYLCKEHIFTILSHLFFIHSFSVSWHGAINGVLWTMPIIFQFYFISIWLYKLINSFKGTGIIVCILITILMKWLTLNYLWVIDANKFGSFAYSIPGRQLWTSLDNFAIGMYVAYITLNKKRVIVNSYCLFGSFACLCGIYFCCKIGMKFGIYGKTMWCCMWHSMLASVIGGFICFVNYTFQDEKKYISRVLLWVSKYEYGIYLWHLLIINNLLENSGLITVLLNTGNYIVVYVILCVFSIATGYIMTELFSIRKDKLFSTLF